METNEVNYYMQQFSNKIPTQSNLVLRDALQKATDETKINLSMAPLYDPTTTLLLSLFLGVIGVDRFYIGDIGLGITKLLLGWLTFGIWSFVDIFLTYKKAKEKNLNKLMYLIN